MLVEGISVDVGGCLPDDLEGWEVPDTVRLSGDRSMLTMGERPLDSFRSSTSSDTSRVSSEAHLMLPVFIALLSSALSPRTLTSASSSSVDLRLLTSKSRSRSIPSPSANR